MSNKELYVFDIDIRPLQQSSNRPYHLEQRMQFRKMQARLTAKAAELNRNAFLEERRTKLAKRYKTSRQMHDQHCQRAQNKEILRRNQLSRLLESAEAKRHLLIFNQAKNCALTVKRAKEVARLHSLRIEKEQEHRRVELDLRINHSSQRRNQILRSIGRKFVSISDHIPLTPIEATLIIQNRWRHLKFSPLINSFKRYKLTLEVARSLEFPVLAVRLKSKPLLKAAAYLLNRARTISSLYSNPGKYKNSVKIFMTAYLISAHPSEILGSTDKRGLANQLRESTETMLNAFELWISDSRSTHLYNNIRQFLALWDEYYYSFEAWKSMDMQDLVDSMTQHFIELDLVWEKFCGEKDSEQEWREEILRQREEIKEQVRNIAGEAAVLELVEKNRLSKQASLEPVSLVVESSSTDVPSSVAEQETNISTSSSSLALEEKLKESFLTPDFPLKNIQGEKFCIRKLAHEIILNPEFRLSPTSDQASQTIRKFASQAFFDDFKEKMESGNADHMLLDLLVEVRSRVTKLLPPSSHFRTKFNSEFDMDLLQQQIERNTFNPMEWIQYTTNTLKSLCAPVRDVMIDNISKISDPFEALRFIFEALDLMLIDHLNHLIISVRPALLTQAVEYETFKFNDLLEKGEVTLNRTKAWLLASVQETRDQINSRNPENTPLLSWPTFEALTSDAFLSIIFSDAPILPETCPETLELDAKRFFDIQNELQCITIVAALIMISKNIASHQLRSDLQAQINLKNCLISILRDGSTTLKDISSFLISHISSGGHELSSDQQEFLTNMVHKTVSYRDSLYLVLFRRLQRIMRQLLISSGERPTFSSSSLTSLGFGVVSEELASIGSRLANLVQFNRQVYVSHYNTILKKATESFSNN